MTSTPAPQRTRRNYRPPAGIPGGKTNWRWGGLVSALVHFGVLLLLLLPVGYGGLITPIEQGAGGPGKAGGGGGRSAARMEIVQYVPVRPAAPPVVKPPPVLIPPPVIMPLIPPPIEQLKPPEAVALGTTTGSAPDPNGGAGPGTGGGVGSGAGTGRGSSIGPGTGGGNAENYPPTPDQIFIPPIPVPASAKGFHVIAEFDVDERGRVLSFKFTETPDRGYNRRLTEVFKGYRFRPGTRPDGTPIRMKAQIVIDLP